MSGGNWRRAVGRLAQLLLLLGLAFGARPAAANQVVSLAEYRQLVDLTVALAVEIEAVPTSEQTSRLDELVERWQAVSAVRLPDGRTILVDPQPLLQQLRQLPAGQEEIVAGLQALQETLARWPTGVHDDDDLTPLAAILARSEFDWPPDEPSLLERLWRQMWTFIEDFLVALSRRMGGEALLGDLLNWVAAGLAFLTVLFILVYAFRGVWGAWAREAELPAGAVPADEQLNADSALRRAQEVSVAGDYRSAVRYLYLSSLLHLDERGLLRYERSLTNKEVLDSVRQRTELAAILREVIHLFDRVWYGFQPIDQETYRQYARQVDHLRRLRQE